MKKLSLHKFHENAGASFVEILDHLIPSDYGRIESELQALNRNMGILDRSYLGKLKLTGKDALDLLNRITTNDLQLLAVGTMVDTVFATPKGRLIDYCRVINSGDGLLLISSFLTVSHLIEWLNRFIILEDVQVSDVSNDYIWLTGLGPRIRQFSSEFTDHQISDAEEANWLTINQIDIPALKNMNFKIPAINFCFAKEHAAEIFGTMVEKMDSYEGRLIGDTAFQIIRVESGMPDWGTEITQDYNPHEARLTNAISFTKGCYTGQEVIARLDTYEKVQKYLMIIEMSARLSHPPPLDLYIDEELVGHLTSAVFNPVSDRSIGLGYVKKMYSGETGLYVEVMDGDTRIPARLKLPPQAYTDTNLL
jgi:folate-binding protein YgfZ